MRRIALAVIIVGGLLGVPDAASGGELGVMLTSPPQGAVVGGLVPLVATTVGAALTVAFDVSVDADAWTTVATDTSGADGWSASWDTAGWGGPAWIRATATDGQAQAFAQVQVIVDNVAPQLAVRLTNVAFSPNDDGRADRTGIEVVLGEPVSLTVWIGDAGDMVRALREREAMPAGPSKVRWRGRDDSGRAVPDGRYLVHVEAVDAAGNLAAAVATMRVDTRAPAFAWREIAPDPFRGIGRVRFAFRIHDRAPAMLVRGRVADAAGRAIAVLEARRLGGGPRRLTWDGHARDGSVTMPGLLHVSVTVRDDAGNVRAATPRPFRDHHGVAPEILRRVESASGQVALTFDDCYDAGAWERILDVLASHRAGGSFFCLGPYARSNPHLARRTVAEGHTIGGHGWDHHDLRSLDGAQIGARLRLEAEAWWDVATATPVPYFRPAGGSLDAEAVRAIGDEGFATIVLWDVDPWDWSHPGPDVVAARVLAHVRAGSIVVLHALDGTAQALPGLIEALRARDLEPVTLAALLSSRRG